MFYKLQTNIQYTSINPLSVICQITNSEIEDLLGNKLNNMQELINIHITTLFIFNKTTSQNYWLLTYRDP